MPHECTECGRVFPDGSKEMLSGCPDCGGNTFQFRPDGESADATAPSSETPPKPQAGDSRVTETVSKATRTVREWVTDRDVATGGRDHGPNRSSGGGDRGPGPHTEEASAESRETGPNEPATVDDDPSTLEPSGTGDYPEWPNPDGADTSGVGKGPSARREREASSERESTADGSNRGPTEESTATERSPREADDADEFEWTKDPASAGSNAKSSLGPEEAPEFDSDHIQARTEDYEDNAQASARSDMVSPDELPGPTAAGGAGPPPTTDTAVDDDGQDSGGKQSPDQPVNSTPNDFPQTHERTGPDPVPDDTGPADGRVVETPSNDGRPDLDELREELNEQFESIKIVRRGQYELNLMELYDRDEYIISLREDGRYVIEVADSWRGDG